MPDGKPNEKRKKTKSSKSWFRSPLFKVALALFLISLIAASSTVLYFYVEYSRIIDRKLSGEIFKNTAKIYATPYHIYPGQKLTPDAVVSRLQRAGFETSDKGSDSDGLYEVSGNRITIHPRSGDPLRLDFQKGTLSRIVKLNGNTEADEAWLPPELVTSLFDESREKRRIVEFKEIPKNLVNALLASEDQRFYSHHGLDPIRAVGALVADLRSRKRPQGGSTLTQQLARSLWASDYSDFMNMDVTLKRKLREAFMAILLEQRLTKQQILTMYANEVYLGQRGSFSIRGFGEGANSYFGKDIGELTLPEEAMLVGVIPAPNAFSPTKYRDRAISRRNLVLSEMQSLGMISK